ncbi:MAG: gluconate 2-dehydrogenase subunit 3 family protein [Gemmatimonadales bacterium]
MDRREAVHILVLAPLAAALGITPAAAERAVRRARATGGGLEPRFFTAHEWDTVRLLVDLILPRDERSGSATDAGVPEFMDFVLAEGSEDARTAMRGGLAWLDTDCRRRFGKAFVACAAAERTVVLDDIAWPARAPPELSHGAAFFTRFRDLTASGFWSSKIGVEDLQYRGNTFVSEWKGCPDEALRKLGVSYR